MQKEYATRRHFCLTNTVPVAEKGLWYRPALSFEGHSCLCSRSGPKKVRIRKSACATNAFAFLTPQSSPTILDTLRRLH